MSAAFEDGGGTDFIGRSVFGNDQADVVISLQDLINAVMQETDADGALSGADLLGGAGTALGVLGDILVQLHQVLHGFVMALDLDHGIDNQLGRSGGIRVGQPDQALVFGLEQIVPGLGRFQIQAGQFFLVDHESQDTLIDAVPVSVRIPEIGLQQMGSILGFIRFQQAVLGSFIVRIVRAAEPDVSGGISFFFGDLGLDFAGAQALIACLDSEEFFKLLAGSDQIGFFAGAVYDQLAFRLGRSDQVGVRADTILSEHGGAAQQHCQSQQNSKQFLHGKGTSLLFFRLPAVRS